MRRLTLVSFAFLACVAATTTLAQGPGERKFHVGVDLGQARLDTGPVFDQPVVGDDESTTWSVKFGYRVNRNFSLEAGYLDLGEYDIALSTVCPAIYPPGGCPAIHSRTSIKGVSVSAVGTWPVSAHFQLTANLGAVYREADFNYAGTTVGGGPYEAKDTVARFGIGVLVPLNERFELALDATQYHDLGVGLSRSDAGAIHTVSEGDASAVSLGVRWRF
jgi:hypothetical protein